MFCSENIEDMTELEIDIVNEKLQGKNKNWRVIAHNNEVKPGPSEGLPEENKNIAQIPENSPAFRSWLEDQYKPGTMEKFPKMG